MVGLGQDFAWCSKWKFFHAYLLNTYYVLVTKDNALMQFALEWGDRRVK